MLMQKKMLYYIHTPAGVATYFSSEKIIGTLPQKCGLGDAEERRLLGIILCMGNSYNQEQRCHEA